MSHKLMTQDGSQLRRDERRLYEDEQAFIQSMYPLVDLESMHVFDRPRKLRRNLSKLARRNAPESGHNPRRLLCPPSTSTVL
jgi:hypothetical protein